MYVYRVVTSRQPTLEDFASNAALKLTPRRSLTPEQLRLWEGLSVFDSFEAAVKLATDSPNKGGFIAVLDLPEDIAIEQTGRIAHHHTVWLPAETLRAAVVSVHTVNG